MTYKEFAEKFWNGDIGHLTSDGCLKAAWDAATLAEREACAKVCERVAICDDRHHEGRATALDCKALIMERSNVL